MKQQQQQKLHHQLVQQARQLKIRSGGKAEKVGKEGFIISSFLMLIQPLRLAIMWISCFRRRIWQIAWERANKLML